MVDGFVITEKELWGLRGDHKVCNSMACAPEMTKV